MGDPLHVKGLIEHKLVSALRTAAAGKTLEQLNSERGRRRIAEITQQNLTERNRLVREGEQARKHPDVHTRPAILECDRAEKAAEALQQAEVSKIEAEAARQAHVKRIEAQQAIELAEVEKQKSLEVAARLQQQAVEVAERAKQERWPWPKNNGRARARRSRGRALESRRPRSA